MTESTTILVVEDEPVTRRGLQLFIQKLGGIEVLDIVGSGEDALSSLNELRPDIVLLDIGLPGMDGIATAKRIKQLQPDCRILMLTANNSNAAIFAAFGAGADGYVLKSSFANSLELAIRAVFCGSVWLDPQIAQSILSIAVRTAGTVEKPLVLSTQEKEILNEVANSDCENGVCFVQPAFVAELKRFRRA